MYGAHIAVMRVKDQTKIKARYDSCSATSRNAGEWKLRSSPMASRVTDTATNLGGKLVDRAATDLGDSYREAKKRVNNVGREVRSEYRYWTGSKNQSKGRKSSSRGGR
jgi:hypothetical protein